MTFDQWWNDPLAYEEYLERIYGRPLTSLSEEEEEKADRRYDEEKENHA